MFLKILQLQKHAQARALHLRKPVMLHLAQFAPTQQNCVLPCTVLNSVRRMHVQKKTKKTKTSTRPLERNVRVPRLN